MCGVKVVESQYPKQALYSGLGGKMKRPTPFLQIKKIVLSYGYPQNKDTIISEC